MSVTRRCDHRAPGPPDMRRLDLSGVSRLQRTVRSRQEHASLEVCELPVGQDAGGSERGEHVEPANLLADVECIRRCGMRWRRGSQGKPGSRVAAVDLARRLELARAPRRLELISGELSHGRHRPGGIRPCFATWPRPISPASSGATSTRHAVHLSRTSSPRRTSPAYAGGDDAPRVERARSTPRRRAA